MTVIKGIILLIICLSLIILSCIFWNITIPIRAFWKWLINDITYWFAFKSLVREFWGREI